MIFWKRIAGCCILAAGVSTAVCAQGAVGSEFSIFGGGTSQSSDASVDQAVNGSFVVVWTLNSSAGDPNRSVHARRFDASGAPIGAAFRVNTYTTGVQQSSHVALNGAGEFVVVWTSDFSSGSDSSGSSIQAQRYASDGNPVGGEFQVNSYTTGLQDHPNVAFLPSGEFLVVWTSAGSFGSDTSPSNSVQLRRFSSSGVPAGAEIQVNSYTPGDQLVPDIGVAADGTFVVAWDSTTSPNGGSDTFSVVARRFDATGAALAPDFQTNTYTTGGQFNASVAVRGNGTFVVGWTSAGSLGTDSSGYSIQARAFDAAGVPAAPEFQVNSYTTSTQTASSIELDAAGGFVAVWQSQGSPENDNQQLSVQGRQFDAGGVPVGDQFQVNTFTSGEQRQPRIGSNAVGGFVVAWQDDPSDAFGSGPVALNGQRFRSGVFVDGFETGNSSRWSSTTP